MSLFCFFRDFLNQSYEGKEKLDGKAVVITGANTGIGKEVARDMAKRGARVLMACRDDAKCLETRLELILDTKNEKIYCYNLDLASLKSIRECAKQMQLSKQLQ